MSKIDKSDIENIKILGKELNSRNLGKISLQKKDYKIEITSKESFVNNSSQNQALPKNEKNKNEEKSNKNIETDKENIISSPMVGIVYLSADPSSAPYIKEGQHVKHGDILFLIEAMKTFNEIKAPKSGVIKKIVILASLI